MIHTINYWVYFQAALALVCRRIFQNALFHVNIYEWRGFPVQSVLKIALIFKASMMNSISHTKHILIFEKFVGVIDTQTSRQFFMCNRSFININTFQQKKKNTILSTLGLYLTRPEYKSLTIPYKSEKNIEKNEEFFFFISIPSFGILLFLLTCI